MTIPMEDDDPMTPDELERHDDAERQDEHYGPDGPPLVLRPEDYDELTDDDAGVVCCLCRCDATRRLFGLPVCGYHETHGEDAPACPVCTARMAHDAIEGRNVRRLTADELPAPTTSPEPTATELLAALEQIAVVTSVVVTALTDELTRERWQHEQTRLQLQGRETRLEVERREHAADRRAWALERAQLVDQLGQMEADVLELLGVADRYELDATVAELRPRIQAHRDAVAAAIEASRYEQPGEVQQRSRTMPLAGGDPDDHALSGS